MTLESKEEQASTVFHLVYVSTAVHRFSDRELETLLAGSRTRNTARGVTGLLVYGGGNFMQLLEGPQAMVRETYARIESDARHCDTTVIVELDTAARWCEDWSMAYARHPDEGHIEGFINLVGQGATGMDNLGDDNIARQLMRNFIEANR